MNSNTRALLLIGLNALAGSSASGNSVIVNVDDGNVGGHLFTQGSEPHLADNQRLVKVGRRFTLAGIDAIETADY